MAVKLRNVAEQLLDILRVEKTERVLDGVESVLISIKEGVYEQWEEYIYQKTNEALAEYHQKCEGCGASIHIKRHRNSITVKGNSESH